MQDKGLYSNETEGNHEAGQGWPEDQAKESIVFTEDREGGRAENHQIECKAEPGDRNPAYGREPASQNLLTSRGDGAGNRFAAFDSKVERIDQSEKRKQKKDDRSLPHLSDLATEVFRSM